LKWKVVIVGLDDNQQWGLETFIGDNTLDVVIDPKDVRTWGWKIDAICESEKVVPKMNSRSLNLRLGLNPVRPLVPHCLGVKYKGNLNTPSSLNPHMRLLRTKLWWNSKLQSGQSLRYGDWS